MRIRTLSDLQAALENESGWRKKELHDLKSSVYDERSTAKRDTRIRAGVALLYAHWEGFVKAIGTAYLNFVAMQRLRYDQLQPCMLAVAARGRLVKAATTSRVETHMDVVRFFREEMQKRSQIDWRNGIQTKSNLRAGLFRQIVLTLGLDYTPYATKEKLIDERLVDSRNGIAHGRHECPTYADYMDLHAEVVWMIEEFERQIYAAAQGRTFAVAPAGTVP